jgi:hypothetical protein
MAAGKMGKLEDINPIDPNLVHMFWDAQMGLREQLSPEEDELEVEFPLMKLRKILKRQCYDAMTKADFSTFVKDIRIRGRLINPVSNMREWLAKYEKKFKNTKGFKPYYTDLKNRLEMVIHLGICLSNQMGSKMWKKYVADTRTPRYVQEMKNSKRRFHRRKAIQEEHERLDRIEESCSLRPEAVSPPLRAQPKAVSPPPQAESREISTPVKVPVEVDNGGISEMVQSIVEQRLMQERLRREAERQSPNRELFPEQAFDEYDWAEESVQFHTFTELDQEAIIEFLETPIGNFGVAAAGAGAE